MPSEQLPVLISEESLRTRVGELARQISDDYREGQLTIVCTLAGSMVFVADLMRRLTVPFTCTYLHTASYGIAAAGEVRIVMDTTEPLEGRDVLVIEGAVVSGATLKYVMDWLVLRRPNSVKSCALLVKGRALRPDVRIDYHGFDVGDAFAVGYGIAHKGRYRGLPYVGVISS